VFGVELFSLHDTERSSRSTAITTIVPPAVGMCDPKLLDQVAMGLKDLTQYRFRSRKSRVEIIFN
jgi:hypothetical protein